jgi:similarity
LLEEDFSEEAIKYALNNVGIDWKQNALEKAKEYAKTPLVSRKVIKEKLDYEDGFDDPEVNYAIDNVDVDWKKAAIEKAKDYAKNNHLSSFNTESELQRENRFTPEEAKYAVENAGIDWKEIALERAKELKQSAPEPDFAISDTRDGLQSEQFRDEEVKYAMDNLKK